MVNGSDIRSILTVMICFIHVSLLTVILNFIQVILLYQIFVESTIYNNCLPVVVVGVVVPSVGVGVISVKYYTLSYKNGMA